MADTAIGGQAVARAALGEASGPWHSAGLQVNYLAAARAQDVVAEALLTRPDIIIIDMEAPGRDTLEQMREIGRDQPKPIILQLPIGAEAEFKGVVDLITQKAYIYGEDGKGKASEIPADLKDEVAAEREALIENIAEADDALVERYLEGDSLSEEDLKNVCENIIKMGLDKRPPNV